MTHAIAYSPEWVMLTSMLAIFERSKSGVKAMQGLPSPLYLISSMCQLSWGKSRALKAASFAAKMPASLSSEAAVASEGWNSLLSSLSPPLSKERRKSSSFTRSTPVVIRKPSMTIFLYYTNSIGHWLKSAEGSSAQVLAGFYDEALSHYRWHAGVMGLSALIIFRQWKHPFAMGPTILWVPGIAGIIYGFAYFALVIEGGTYPLGLPFALLVSLFILLWRRKNLRQQPVLAFFLAAHLAALSFFAIWAALWGGLPQFSETGIIN